MRAFASLLAASLALAWAAHAPPAEGRPQRVASLNLCTERCAALARPIQIVRSPSRAESAQTPLGGSAPFREKRQPLSVAPLRRTSS